MEKYYGGITITYEPVVNSIVRIRVLKCTWFGYENIKRRGSKVHISRKHNELGKSYDVALPYFPSKFATSGGLNRRMYNKIPPVGKKQSTSRHGHMSGKICVEKMNDAISNNDYISP